MITAHRTLAAAAVAAGSAVGAVALLASIGRLAAAGLTRLDEVVSAGVQVVGLGILLWYLATAVVALVCLGARSAGAVWVAGERRLARCGAPLARRLLGVGAGVAVAAAAMVAPAVAASPPALELTDDLGWGATQEAEEPTEEEPSQAPPSTSSGGSSSGTRPGTSVPATAPSEADQASSYVVVAGDTLWDIAADHLPASADAADIAASWPDWYELNREVVGSDPDLIHPGQVLVAPDHHTEEGA